MATPSRQSQGPVQLLSIDGGGIRGLSALVLLEQIMDMANEERRKLKMGPLEPWQMFDMICGTSTGGLIAIMLGRLRMTIENCKKAYIGLAEEAFTLKNSVARAYNKSTMGPQFKTGPLEKAIKRTIGKGWESALLKEDDEGACKVFVVSHILNIDEPVVLRSYRNIQYPARSFKVMHIWEACRATSAAITFFDPIVVNGTTYSDGGLLYNNPVQLLHGEASEIFQDREQRIISLGTGIARSKKFDPAMLSIAKALAKIATETELTANDFHRRNDCEAAQAGRYFRFNVPGIGDISMEEAEKLNDITNLTEAYLEQAEISKKALLCARKLAGGTYMGKDTTKSESLHVEGQKADGNPELSLLERMHRLKSPNGV